jgi:hypothetical protein
MLDFGLPILLKAFGSQLSPVSFFAGGGRPSFARAFVAADGFS